MYRSHKLIWYLLQLSIFIFWSKGHSQIIQTDTSFYATGEIRAIWDYYLKNDRKEEIHWANTYYKNEKISQKLFITKNTSKFWTYYHLNGKISREQILGGDITYDTLGNVNSINISYGDFRFRLGSIKVLNNSSSDSL